MSPISRGPAPRLVFLSWHINKVSIYLSDTKSQRLLVTRHRLSCEKVNLHNTLITWVWDAYAHTHKLVVSWCCGSPNDVTFSLFCVSHYHKVQVFIQPLQILISAKECKISVGFSVPSNSLTTFNLIKRQFNWHEPTNRQLTNFVGLSVPTNSLTNSGQFET